MFVYVCRTRIQYLKYIMHRWVRIHNHIRIRSRTQEATLYVQIRRLVARPDGVYSMVWHNSTSLPRMIEKSARDRKKNLCVTFIFLYLYLCIPNYQLFVFIS